MQPRNPASHLWRAAILGLALIPPTAAEPPPFPTVGAIRWDAWHGDLSDVGLAVQACLDPPRYRHRAPWFATVDEGGALSIRCDREGVMAQEAEYARRARLVLSRHSPLAGGLVQCLS